MEKSKLETEKIVAQMAQLCSRSEQCSADIRKKIMAYEIVEEIVDEIIEKLIEEKFIDDERYVHAYINDKFKINKWGKLKMRYYLHAKGLSDEIIEKGLAGLDDEKYISLLIKTMKAKAKSIRNKDKYKKMGQIIRFTQSRGFEPELIHRYLNMALE